MEMKVCNFRLPTGSGEGSLHVIADAEDEVIKILRRRFPQGMQLGGEPTGDSYRTVGACFRSARADRDLPRLQVHVFPGQLQNLTFEQRLIN